MQQALVAIIFQALRRLSGAMLFCSSRTSSRLGFPFWRLCLTLRSSGPAFGGPLTLSVRYQLNRAQFLLTFIGACLAALILVTVLAWMTSGSWSPLHIHWANFAIIFPMLLAVKLGLGNFAALTASFFTYWVIAFTLIACYFRSKTLEIRPVRKKMRSDCV